jgi:DNA (cytosine-5)-methyltransferase 1
VRALDLFTGYGGITLALQDYVEPIAYVEIEEYAQRIIAERMADGSLPRAPILADVKNVRGSFGICDIIYGGFPCQDISVAGNGKGLAGERSGLFYEIVRLTKEIRPSFIFLENVPAIRTRGLEQVIKAFTEVGYDCRWTMLSASSVGAPHKRERWFLLAHPQRDRGGTTPKTISRSENESEKLQSENWQSCTHDPKAGGEPVAYTWGERLNSWWEIEPNVGRVADGVTFRVDRLKAIGNGVVPLQVKTAFELLMGIN